MCILKIIMPGSKAPEQEPKNLIKNCKKNYKVAENLEK